ncbi:MAG: HEAT repeat domain-containing protein [candidate division Zixibacteria bacterium]|nr:HEAT repeat domain-containing protein [candidate division Zixibacteria bacterium]
MPIVLLMAIEQNQTAGVQSGAERLAEIRILLKDLLKVIKVVTMYPAENSLPQSMRRSFGDRLTQHIEEYGDVRITVNRDTLVCDGETVYIDKSKEEALAGLFFDTGITSFTFRSGYDPDSAARLLNAIKTYLNAPKGSVDLANLLWESGTSRFLFTTLEDVSLPEYQKDFNARELGLEDAENQASKEQSGSDAEPYESIFDNSGDDGKDPAKDAPRWNDIPLTVGTGINPEPARAQAAATAMGMTDLPAAVEVRTDTTLLLSDEHRLSEEEEQDIARMIAADADFDLRESTLELCNEMLHQETELADFAETVTICSKVATEFLREGKLIHAGRMLAYMKNIEDTVRADRATWAEKLAEVRRTFGSRDRMEVLGEVLNLHDEIGADDLHRYLKLFDWESLGPMTDLLGELTSDRHRDAVCDHLAVVGRSYLPMIARGMSDKRPQAVRGAIIVLSRIGGPQALEYMKKALANSDPSVRLALIKQLRTCSGPEIATILRQAVADPVAEVRTVAVTSLASMRGEGVYEAVAAIITGRDFDRLEPEQSRKLMIAYSELGGGRVVPFLVAHVCRFNPTGNSILGRLRALAFEALSHNTSDEAERALLELTRSWRPGIKHPARTALKRRREIVYGGGHG